jgi:transcriptional regulator with XRE-family HTH domain
MSTAELLTRARHEARLSQSEFAIRARTSRPTLSAYEHGRTSPSMETAARLLAAAGQELTAGPRSSLRNEPSPAVAPRPCRPSAPTARAPGAGHHHPPLHLNWSEPDRQFKLSDRAQRARVYEIVLREGTPR